MPYITFSDYVRIVCVDTYLIDSVMIDGVVQNGLSTWAIVSFAVPLAIAIISPYYKGERKQSCLTCCKFARSAFIVFMLLLAADQDRLCIQLCSHPVSISFIDFASLRFHAIWTYSNNA